MNLPKLGKYVTYLLFSHYYIENGQFIVARNSVYQEMVTVEGTTYSTLLMSLTLDRRPTYYLLNMIVPCSVLSMLSSLAFCLPVSSGERVSLQITVILSYGIYQMMLTEYIPNHATKIPILSMFKSFRCLKNNLVFLIHFDLILGCKNIYSFILMQVSG